MSEGDRAAKAARAKAMLKKRQREKAGGVPATTSPPNVESPISPMRTLSPAPQEPVEEAKRDLGDVFKGDPSDMSWLSSLPRSATPPPPPSRLLSPPVVTSLPDSSFFSLSPPTQPLLTQIHSLQSENASLEAEVKRLQALELKWKQADASLDEQRTYAQQLREQLQKSEGEKETAVQDEQRTISLLVSEKSSLTTELQRLADVDSKFLALENVLKDESQKLKDLYERFRQLQIDEQESAKLAREFQSKDKELSERLWEKERELQLTKSSMSHFKKEAEQHQRRVRELEEQIQSDDRVERLENSLTNTQERAVELEFQLTKLKQAHTTLKAERDDYETRLIEYSKAQSELETKQSELQGMHVAVQQQLTMAISEKDNLAREKSELLIQVESTRKALPELQEKLVQAAVTITSNTRLLQSTQNDLRSATRRAEEAETTQKDLQSEGTTLMRSLDEMRPKIVELTGVKLELTERISSLELDLRYGRDIISRLETAIDEVTEQKEELEGRIQGLLSEREKERTLASADSSELQKAYDELREELTSAHASLRNLEAERSSHLQDMSHRLDEIERITSSSRAKTEELLAVRQELDAIMRAQDEGQEFLENAQNEIETLRADLNAREEEVERLREVTASPTKSGALRPLDDELLSSLRQQHALELSAAHSQIRALENSVFDANARSHALQKQIGALESQLLPTSRLGQRSFSPVPRPSSRTQGDIRRSSFGSHRPNSNLAGPIPLARSIFDQNMSAQTRHKRLVSLSMLKARIDSEAETTTSRPSSRASSLRALSPVASEDEYQPGYVHAHSHPSHTVHRPQFLDDSHVFWCNSCDGDLVIL